MVCIHSQVLTSFLRTARVKYLIALLRVGPGSGVGVRDSRRMCLLQGQRDRTDLPTAHLRGSRGQRDTYGCAAQSRTGPGRLAEDGVFRVTQECVWRRGPSAMA